MDKHERKLHGDAGVDGRALLLRRSQQRNLASKSFPFPLGMCASAWGRSLIVYLLFFFFGWLCSKSDLPEEISLIFVHSGAAVSLYVFWREGNWGNARHDCFGAALLLISALLRIQAVVDAALYGSRIESIPDTVPIPDSVIHILLKGELLTHWGVLIVVSAWRLRVGSRIEEFSFLHNYRVVQKKIPVGMYLLALIVEVLRRIIGANFGGLAQLSGTTYSLGVVAIFFLANGAPKRLQKLSYALALAMPLVILALGTGMKENMVFPLVPAALIYWFSYRRWVSRLSALTVAMMLLAYSQLYVHYVRETTWREDSKEISIGELLSGFQEYLEATSLVDGLDSINARINMTTTHGITVGLADHDGIEPVEIFGSIPLSFVPRLFWPDKPALQPGAMHTVRIQKLQTPLNEVKSATAAGFSTELYLGGGYWGVLLGAGVYGWLLASAQLACLRKKEKFWALSFSFISVYWALRFEENHVLYAYTSVVFMWVFIFAISSVRLRWGSIRLI